MIAYFRERLTLVLLILLPLHALLVTVGTKLILGSGQAPWTVLALWKEALLGIVLLLAFLEWLKKPTFKFDYLDGLIMSLLVVGVVVTFATHRDLRLFAYGFRYDFVPLLAFVALRRVSWSVWFQKKALIALLVVGGVVALYGMFTLWLPQSVFTWLGYSDLHSLYNPGGPVAAYQQIGGMGLRRIQSTLSGPNQLGLWLLIPLSISLIRRRPDVALFSLIALALSFSRSAFLATGLIVAVVLKRLLRPQQFSLTIGLLLVATTIGMGLLHGYSPQILLRSASTSDHITRPIAAFKDILAHPLGQGLGTAGPASNRTSDTCAFYEAGADTSWVPADSPLCIFAGDEQVHPLTRECQCPNLPENWYLQMGVEMGVLGMALFITLVVMVLWRLRSRLEIFLPFLGISVACLFLHAWEDSAVSYTLWVLAAGFLSLL